MNAAALLEGLPLRPLRPGDAAVRAIETDSRAVRAGSLFFARRGWFVDANAFVPQALDAGASALIVTREDAVPANCAVPVWLSESEDRDLGLLAARFCGHPTRSLTVFGVTGTNGKTSVSAMLEHMLRSCGQRVGVIGTVTHRFESDVLPARNTTPDGKTIHELARRWFDAGATCLVLEVSSHGAALDRIAGIAFDRVGFTNLTVDHLDFHETFDAYRDAKALLFSRELERAAAHGKQPRAAAFVDDAHGAAMLDAAPADVPRCRVSTMDAAADLRLELLESTASGARVRLHAAGRTTDVDTTLIGAHNVANAAVALGMLDGVLDPHEAVATLATFPGVPGRFEAPLRGDGAPAIFVDYAHTPDAVENALRVLRSLGPAPRTVVLGCGGDRDRTKRPLMARAAVEGAERVILTSDNPRSEDPQAILDDMLAGLSDAEQASVVVEPDRAAAVAQTLGAQGPVLIAGKGHEAYQEIAGARLHLDDREEVRRAAASVRMGSEAPLLSGWSAERIAAVCGGTLQQVGHATGWGALRTDSREVGPHDVFVALRGERHDAHAFVPQVIDAGAGLLVVDRDVAAPAPVAVVRVDDGVAALGRLASGLLGEARRRNDGLQAVGITGSNGKTTTKQIAASLLDAALVTPGNWNNHIGLPLTVARLRNDHRVAVLEMGANRPTDIDELAAIARPEVGVVTSIGHAHTEGFGGGLDSVRRAKAGMLRSSGARVGIVPHDEAQLPIWLDAASRVGEVQTFGPEGCGADLTWSREGAHGMVTLRSGGALPPRTWTTPLALPGQHNASNLAAAWLACLALDPSRIDDDATTLSTRLGALEAPAGRLQVSDRAGSTLIDDSYNANPTSMRAALDVLAATEGSPRVAVLGEMKELGGDVEQAHAELGAYAAERADEVWAVGRGARAIADGAGPCGHWFATPELAGDALAGVPRGAVVLVKGSRGAQLERAIARWNTLTETR